MDLTGHVALITGGSRGLGRAFAQGLVTAGARVAITGRSARELHDTAVHISPAPGQVVALPADVTDPAATQHVIETVERQMGGVTLLVNNALSFHAFGPIGAVDPNAWWREIEVNLRGPFLYTAAVLPGMRSRHAGRVINVASGSGLVPTPLASAYSVSKTALIRLTEILAQETADAGIRVFAIHPGTVRTPMTAYVHDSPLVGHQAPAIQQWFRAAYAEGRDTPVERVVTFLLRLAAGDADALSGWYLRVDDDLDAFVAQCVAGPRTDRRTLRLSP